MAGNKTAAISKLREYTREENQDKFLDYELKLCKSDAELMEDIKKELRKKAGVLFYQIEQVINSAESIFVVAADSDMDLTQKQVKKLTLNEIGDLVGRGEAECAALSKAKDIPIIISDNSTEFKYLSEFIMLTHFDLLALCVHHGIMDAGEAEAIYNDINNILDRKSGDSLGFG